MSECQTQDKRERHGDNTDVCGGREAGHSPGQYVRTCLTSSKLPNSRIWQGDRRRLFSQCILQTPLPTGTGKNTNASRWPENQVHYCR